MTYSYLSKLKLLFSNEEIKISLKNSYLCKYFNNGDRTYSIRHNNS